MWTREQAFSGPFEALGPDLSMVLADGGTISILPSETIVARRRSCAATTAGRASSSPPGPGIRAGATVDELSIVDVAPLLLHQLGLAVPDDMAGRVPAAIFEPGSWSGDPPRRAAAPPPAGGDARRASSSSRRSRPR